MLHAAIEPVDEGALAYLTAVPINQSLAPVQRRIETGRYSARSRINIPVVGSIVIGHALILAAVIQARTHHVPMAEDALTVVNLAPPPPPPADEAPPPPPAAPQIVAQPPIVQVPAPPPLIQTSPEMVPIAVMDVRPAPPSPLPPSPPAPSAAQSIVQGGDIGAQMMSGRPPRYPIESRRKREQGTVVLALTLAFDGAVETLALAHSSGFKRLDDAAKDAVQTWRWKPVLRDGQPMRVKGLVEIPFVLRAEN